MAEIQPGMIDWKAVFKDAIGFMGRVSPRQFHKALPMFVLKL